MLKQFGVSTVFLKVFISTSKTQNGRIRQYKWAAVLGTPSPCRHVGSFILETTAATLISVRVYFYLLFSMR